MAHRSTTEAIISPSPYGIQPPQAPKNGSKSLPPLTVKNGTFAALLKIGTGFQNGTSEATLFQRNLWLQIKIGNEAPLTPRQQLVSVAYAMKSDSIKDGGVTTNSLGENVVTSSKIADSTIGNADLASDAASLAKVSGGLLASTGNRLFYPNGVIQNGGSALTETTDLGLYNQINGQWTRFVSSNGPFLWYTDGGVGTTAKMRLEAGGKLGLGTSAPGMSLEVRTPSYYGGPAVGASYTDDKYAYLHVGAGDHSLIWNNSAAMRFGTETTRGSGYVEHMRIAPYGFVGIGTSAPAASLHIHTGSNGVPLYTEDGTRRFVIQHLDQSGNNGVGFGTTSNHPLYFATNSLIHGQFDANGDFRVFGALYAGNLPFGDYRNVQWNNATGQFFYDNSSRRHKENITPLKDDFEKLLQAVPVTYTRPGKPNRWEIGFIAEDFDALGLKKLVDYAEDGKTPEGINYEKICLYLTAIAKKQSERMEELHKQKEADRTAMNAIKAENHRKEARISELEARLTALAQAVEALKAEKK